MALKLIKSRKSRNEFYNGYNKIPSVVFKVYVQMLYFVYTNFLNRFRDGVKNENIRVAKLGGK